MSKPKGLYYFPNIINFHKTRELTDILDKNNKWTPLSEANSRLVQHFGYKYDYTSRKIKDEADPIPEYILKLRDILTKICIDLKLIDSSFEFNQCIINNYLPGEGISKHIDLKNFGDVIGCFTIGAATMKFTRDGYQDYNVYTENGSLYIMSNEARNIWYHEMPNRVYDNIGNIKVKRGRRISITFRHVPKEISP